MSIPVLLGGSLCPRSGFVSPFAYLLLKVGRAVVSQYGMMVINSKNTVNLS